MNGKKLITFLLLVVTLLSNSKAQEVGVQWGYLSGLSYYGRGNQSLTKSGRAIAWGPWARSSNIFNEEEDATLSYEFGGNSNETGILLAIGTYRTSYSLSTVEYGFKIENSKVYFLKGNTSLGMHSISSGDVIELNRTQSSPGSWNVEYTINGTIKHSKSASSAEYRAYAMISTPGSLIAGVKGKKYVTVHTVDSDCPGANGSASAMPNAGIPPYTFSWSTGETTSSVYNLAPGTYSVTVNDAGFSSYYQVVQINNKVNWAVESNVTTTPTSIQRNTMAGASGFGVSNNTLPSGDAGTAEFLVINQSGLKSFGFGTSITQTAPDYGFFFINNTFSYTTAYQTLSSPVSFNSTDKFKITKGASGTFKYYKNNVYLGGSSGTAASQMIVASVGTYNSGFKNISLSFCGYAELTTYYAQPKNRLDGGTYETTNNRLKFLYKGEYSEHPAEFNIKNELGTLMASQTTTSVNNTQNGSTQIFKISDGYYEVDLSSFAAGIYVLEIEHPENETQYLRFRK